MNIYVAVLAETLVAAACFVGIVWQYQALRDGLNEFVGSFASRLVESIKDDPGAWIIDITVIAMLIVLGASCGIEAVGGILDLWFM